MSGGEEEAMVRHVGDATLQVQETVCVGPSLSGG